jgi:hypothetical protein
VGTILAITTTERVGVDYLSETIRQIESTGGDLIPKEDKILYCDGPVSKKPDVWTCVESPVAQGSRDAFWNCVRIAHERGADLLGFEDDILLCKNAITAMMQCQVPDDVAFLTFFDNVSEAGHPAGLHTYPLDGELQFWGVQAVKIPYRSLEYLLRTDMEVITPRTKGRRSGRDYAIQQFLAKCPWPVWGTVFPHWAQHVGDVSIVRSNRALRYEEQGLKRESKNWNPNHDALVGLP